MNTGYLALAVAGTIATYALVNAAATRLDRSQHTLTAPMRGLRNLVVPLLGLVVIGRVSGAWADSGVLGRLVETLMWITVIHVALSFVNHSFFIRREGTEYHSRIPKLFLDIVRTLLVLIGACIVFAYVWGFDLGNMVATLGVTSIVLGLALQNTLDNVMAGIALLFERPFAVGDWVAVGTNVGQVTEVNWRSVRVRTRNQDHLVIPNSVLGKEILMNYSRPTRVHGEDVMLGFSYDDPPNKVKRVLLQAALATRGVLADPGPKVRTKAYSAYSIDYQVKLFIDDQLRLNDILDEFMTQVWYVARRNGLTIPFPTQTSYEYHMPVPAEQTGPSARSVLATVPFFVPMSPEELENLAQDAVVLRFGRGERVVHQGDPGDALFFIREGKAIVTITDQAGGEREVARLGRGEFFGEMALLTGEPRSASVTAVEDLDAIMIHKEALQVILARRPGLAQEMAEIVEARRRGLRAVADLKAMPQQQRDEVRAASSDLVVRIKRFLGL